ncbi:hypothetical protein [Pararhodobacter aggregans]|uniref:Uncharacterized protein n=1 Tax=Pararhodobacter aggregans TaxID=404875 RepID=A0A2T7UR27_9RHOB|nr:hypothetical protein [Pararhodobacter aggregans]PTX01843.1 hypothetical protein C8N33_10660 [Pararhodobacter aggregans]PVE47041.1 hypothetical protein DDE23_12340 [Pararhodobacter aggregans]
MNRRDLLRGAAALSLTMPPVAALGQASAAELIEYHARALHDLVRRHGPEEANRIAVHVRSALIGAPSEWSVQASFARDEWSADARLRGGGLNVTREVGYWDLRCPDRLL